MANFIDVALWEEVYQLATTDPVLGGPNGIDNLAPSQLANRTKWLRTQIDNAGITDAIEYSGAMIDLKKSGFYIIAAGATGKPSTSSGACVVIAKDSLSNTNNNYYLQIFVASNGAIYSRSYVNNAINPLSTDWVQYARLVDLAAFTSSLVGSVSTFAIVVQPNLSNLPAGWLQCNGQAVSRNAYANLFSVIGANYGNGDGINTFNLPNIPDTAQNLIHLIKF